MTLREAAYDVRPPSRQRVKRAVSHGECSWFQGSMCGYPQKEIELGAWLFLPDGAGPWLAITMAHGYTGTKEHGIERFAMAAYAAAGFVVLVHDHRNFGTSDGEPRGDVDPWRQIGDWRRAISISRRARTLIRRASAFGERAMRRRTRSPCSVACGPPSALRRCAGADDQRLRAGTCGGFHRMLCPRLSRLSAKMTGAVARREPSRRQAIVSADPPFPPPIASQEAHRFLSCSQSPRGFGTTRSLFARRGPHVCMSRGLRFHAYHPHRCFSWSLATTR